MVFRHAPALGSHNAPKAAAADYNLGDESKLYDDGEVDERKKPATVLGLTPKVLWIVIIFILVLLAVGIGAGIGGGLAARSKKAQ